MNPLHRAFGAPMKHLFKTALALTTVTALLAPSVASAATPYTFQWARTEYADSCETASLSGEGLPFFETNQVPLPTYTVPGSQTQGYDGSSSIKAEAGFQSVLLHTGINNFIFQVSIDTGDNSCVDSHEVVSLESPALAQPKLLFNVNRVGTNYIGNAALDLQLQEINPPLARDLANLQQAIIGDRKALVDNASKTANLAAQETLLQQMDADVESLVNAPLDSITQQELDALLDKYSSIVDPATKAAFDALINDEKKSLTDLQTEIDSLLDNFGAQADAAANLATQAATASGWNPDDPSSYELGDAPVPVVTVPDISNTPGAFDPGNDPYDAYASQVIKQLGTDVVNGTVTNRGDFVANVRAWRANEAALQAALKKRAGVSQAEDGAFIRGQARVTAYVGQFMDSSDWFSDTAVPGTLRAYVDGIFKDQFADAAYQLKDALNLWPPRVLSPAEQQFSDLVTSFSGGLSAMAAVDAELQGYVHVAQIIAVAAARVGVGFIPVVGEVVDLCEAVTGKAFCLPNGEDLTDEERLMSAAGFGIGVYWRGAMAASTSGRAVRTAEEASRLVDAPLGQALRLYRLKQWRTLRAATADIAALNPFEKVVATSLQSRGYTFFGIGTDGIASVLKVPRDAVKTPDFINITKDGLLWITEAKGLESVESGGVNITHCLEKFAETNTRLKALGYGATDIANLEIAMPKGGGMMTGALGSDLKPIVYSAQGIYLVQTNAGVTTRVVDSVTGLFIRVLQL